MEKEETLLRKRLIELSNNAYQRGIIMYSDFLNLNKLPKSFLLCESDGVGRVYVSHLAPSTLRRRVENTAAALR